VSFGLGGLKLYYKKPYLLTLFLAKVLLRLKILVIENLVVFCFNDVGWKRLLHLNN
jgi:hypothetical protein